MPVNTILGLFAKSPLKPLQEHASRVHECCSLLIPFFAATAQQQWDQAQTVREQISNLEKQADTLKREIRLKLPRGLFLPVDRGDMLELVTQQDRLANRAKDIAGRVIGRQLQIPQVMQADFMNYLQRCLDATALSNKVIHEMDELLETGFRGREADLVEQMVMELDHIEDDTDHLQILLRQALLALEGELNPVDIMFLYQIIEWVGGLADKALRVGSRLELMLARS
ncbi:TIGR00153 family protein [Edwardsiella hoshinae]|uniref:Phosphate transport regulator (Distant homolog of PhoU) n=1 Tax=Edwardsiella hoshinae TaxID=93378 RepID=A0A376DL97_9GAMM|nr:TIGR00153 family protein [Edwardsiella hoshinae]AOV97981.1 TIGR00153 family protein [Edwardsiella hoshinae]QPR29141.1 TIGR00153 family protein [Edwardsiella hoshinae]STC91324.1 Phosphate transport regulator (distant homolog of PhoU) [Edwardsiella hoshinae]